MNKNVNIINQHNILKTKQTCWQKFIIAQVVLKSKICIVKHSCEYLRRDIMAS